MRKKAKKKKNIKTILKSNLKLIIGIVIGITVSSGVYAATILFAGDAVSYDNTTSGLTSTNVQDALDELKLKANTCLPEKELKVGSYIFLTPDASTYTIPTSVTGYSSTQTIVPNELTLWRIININDNGTYDAVSEYVSSTAIYFYGTRGYANFVGGLQTIASAYAKSGYTTATRMMGYDGQVLTISNQSAFNREEGHINGTSTTPSPTEGTGQNYTYYSTGDMGDTLYLKDYQLVSNLYKNDNNETNYCASGVCAYKIGTTTTEDYWIASRYYYCIGDNNSTADFEGRYLSKLTSVYGSPYGGVLNATNLRATNGSGYFLDYGDNSPKFLRPIITLNSEIAISKGTGSKSAPFRLS